jgi:beta-lactamase class D
MRKWLFSVTLCAVAALSIVSRVQAAPTTDLADCFSGYDGACVVYDEQKKDYVRFNADRCARRFSPCSTFKIPNSLISLETGAVESVDQVFKWDGRDRGVGEWNQDQTMRTAFARSAVWYYQEAAARVGKTRMAAYLKKLNYGNQDMSGGLTRFWLGNSLQISADEQVEFLRHLINYDLPVSRPVIDKVKEIMIVETKEHQVLRGKTGSGMSVEGKRNLNWFVGYLTNESKTYVFATNISGEDIKDRFSAMTITKRVLERIGAMQ